MPNGKTLQTFITATFGVAVREQTKMVERIAAAMAEVGPQVRDAMREHPGFVEIGKRMLLAWQEGLAGLRDKRTYALGDTELGEAFTGFPEPKPIDVRRRVIGHSDLLGKKR